MIDYWNGYPVIDDTTTDGEILGLFDGEAPPVSYGYVPRDWDEQPEGDGIPMYNQHDPQQGIPIIPTSEWDARITEQERLQCSLEHLYLSGAGGGPAFVNLDQVSDGYCWIYSTVHAMMISRLIMNQPYVRLNPHSGGAIIKNGRNEGGWCGLSARWIAQNGIAPEGNGPLQWPAASRNLTHNTPAMREEMKKYRLVESWMDLSRREYDQKMTDAAHASLLLSNVPCASDYNWWAHSVCALRLVRIEAGSYGRLILNSWRNWGRHGLGVLRGSRGVPNEAVGVRAVTAV